MYKVGITGGIGSGKTTICKVFEVLGIPVFYADAEAKSLMVKDEILVAGVKETFGAASYFDNGSLNNKHLANIVFNQQEALAQLNALVHPAVFRAFEAWEKQMEKQVPYVLKEAALLFESGSFSMCDTTVLVTAPMAIKLKRVMARDQATETQIKARMDKQFSDEIKSKMANYFIKNDEQCSIITQVLELHQKLINQSNLSR